MLTACVLQQRLYHAVGGTGMLWLRLGAVKVSVCTPCSDRREGQREERTVALSIYTGYKSTLCSEEHRENAFSPFR